MPKLSSLFNPKDLKPLGEFCSDGTLRIHPKTAERFAREGKLPAVKVGAAWMTTPTAVRSFIWKRSNSAFKKVAS